MRCLLDDIWGVTTRLDTYLPQVLLGSLEQGTPLDVWAAGVVVMSLLARRYPLFLAAQDRSDEPALLQVRPQTKPHRLEPSQELRRPQHTLNIFEHAQYSSATLFGAASGHTIRDLPVNAMIRQ